MQLINVHTLRLEEFTSSAIPPYAILSHRWVNGEISQKEYTQSPLPQTILYRPAYGKIMKLCERAKIDGLKYVWIDTCCIDKSSSAELSEAINSMYKWYERADVCYAYLNDVHVEADSDTKEFADSMAESQWFTRGWTLQELIAPRQVVFFSSSWNRIGTRRSLAHLIFINTGIDEPVLNGRRSIFSYSVARRMSWAAGRKTSRPEDVAYSLIGLFDVNMPLLYGEGTKAFIRLQEEILKGSDDHSIFAWKDPSADDSDQCGLLATSPDHFRLARNHRASSGRDPDSLLVTLNNTGLSINLQLYQDTELMYGILNCEGPRVGNKKYGMTQRVGIYLECIDVRAAQFRRVRANSLALSRKSSMSHRIYVKSAPQVGLSPLTGAQKQVLKLLPSVAIEEFEGNPTPKLKGCWVAPQSVLLRDSGLDRRHLASTRTHWSYLPMDMSQRPDLGDHDISKCLFSLPPILDAPAVMLHFENLPALVIGRGPGAKIFLSEASSALVNAAKSSLPYRSGLWAPDTSELCENKQWLFVSGDGSVAVQTQFYTNLTPEWNEFHISLVIRKAEPSQ